MLQDNRFNEEDIISVLENLKINGGRKFNFNILDSAKVIYKSIPKGSFSPKDIISGKSVLILGPGKSVKKYNLEIQNFIKKRKPYVIELNTNSNFPEDIIDARAVCHPVRLLADLNQYLTLPQPIITPISMLRDDLKESFKEKIIYDFGLGINSNEFIFHSTYCELPTPMVIAYVLAFATSGKANQILLAGFDGYNAEDSRFIEMEKIFNTYKISNQALPLTSLTPSNYQIKIKSIFGF